LMTADQQGRASPNQNPHHYDQSHHSTSVAIRCARSRGQR
jgi:hypothetical protein